MQVDEYEVEIENMTNKLKEKEHTIKNLITSAEEKDNLIVKIKSKLIAPNETAVQLDAAAESYELDSNLSFLSKDERKQRKIEGLLKLIYEKNQQIEALKTELNEYKSKANASSSMSDDLNSSFLNSSNSNGQRKKPPPPPTTTVTSGQQSVKILVDSLEKEIEIYQKLNSPETKEL